MISLNNSWKELISQNEQFEENWYIKRKKTLGNYKYVQWKIIWPAIILSLILLRNTGYINTASIIITDKCTDRKDLPSGVP